MIEHVYLYASPSAVERLETGPRIGWERLRQESFSACCGAYARVDLLPGAYDAERTALAQLREKESARLTVSAGEVELATDRGSAVERKLKLPLRCLKGFIKVQSHRARIQPRFTLSGVM